jgi:murein DD-endopeptidase MepM/ murein hydrolase activator NlpD
MNPSKDEPSPQAGSQSKRLNLIVKISWGVTFFVVVLMVSLLIWDYTTVQSSPEKEVVKEAAQPFSSPQVAVDLPQYEPVQLVDGVTRQLESHTTAPTRPRTEVVEYTVEMGDSIFGIAQQFNIKPESILWANFDILNDNPDMISPGLALHIPPVDGIYYQWQDGDTLSAVAQRYKAEVDQVLNWQGNRFDLTNPQVAVGESIMIPGGSREFKQWLVPTIPRGPAGVLKSVLGPGACDTSEGGWGGSGSFVWPADNHYLSGNDYWSGHLGIDIAAGLGAPLYAADSGLVVYSGPAYGGYGNMIMIDHNNGYQTLYAHLSSLAVSCGQGVSRGQYIGGAGSTGNSTGPHLHFEVRYLGGWISPWYVLP